MKKNKAIILNGNLGKYRKGFFYFQPYNGGKQFGCKSSENLDIIWTKDTKEFVIEESKIIGDKLTIGNCLFDFNSLEITEVNIKGFTQHQKYSLLWYATLDYVGFYLKNETNIIEGIISLQIQNILWKRELYSFYKDYSFEENIIIKVVYLDGKIDKYGAKGKEKAFLGLQFLTGETLWQRSFKELGITSLDKFIGDIDNILVCACGKTILGLDKNTGEIHWKLRHRSEAQYTLLNPSTGCLYQLYGWADSGSNNSLILLEIDAKTGTILYDKSIFKHPNYQPIDNLGTEQDWKYPRFHNAVQWKEKVYFLVNPTGTSWLANVFEFDCIQKRVTKVSDELYATTNSIFVAEGKLFINSEICKKVASRDNLENDKWSRAISIPRMDGEKEYSEYYAISKESYLTIFDLEDN
ncbi:hypothetical protein [Arcicella rigui]|uniref:Uncharacterized protein n=1 Tax=Arcicella rigui TaxID=797020 RepID=A0ABU5QAA3_9BACT|nr:hypothetical protein [Arcicella rigui]MEA5139658.1 hypothetical protein [Arcicella rigui]